MFPIYTVYIGNIHIDIYIYICVYIKPDCACDE